MARILYMDARAHLGVGSNRIEVAQGNRFEVISMAEIFEHHLHHVFGARIRAQRLQRGFLGHHKARHDIIDGSGGAKDHAGVTQVTQLFKENHGFDHIFVVVVIGSDH